MESIYDTPPPKFGHQMLKHFSLDPAYTNLNHGSYGSVPLPVQSYAHALSLRIEANPDLFMRLEYQPLLADVRARLATFIGAQTDECVIVPNASHGINTVLRNFEWRAEDVIVVFNTTYGSIARTAHYLSDISPHPSVSEVALRFPTTHAALLFQFREHLRALAAGMKGKGKIVAVIDSIVSNPGVLMPWREMVAACREVGAWSVVDAAHSIGQEVGINLGEAQPDFWVSNCHKWLYAKRSCAVLYVPERNRHIIKATFPTSYAYVSPSSLSAFHAQFEWTGTIDFVPYLSVAAALDFRRWIGGEATINAYCHNLAVEGGKRLAEVLGTEVLDTTGELTLNMVNVALPLPRNVQPTLAVDRMFKTKLLQGSERVYAANFYHGGRWWMRCSAQVYNEIADFEKLGRVYLRVCREIIEELEEGEVKAKL